jgi:hypothetical protein
MDSPLFCAVVEHAREETKKAYEIFGCILHITYVRDLEVRAWVRKNRMNSYRVTSIQAKPS